MEQNEAKWGVVWGRGVGVGGVVWGAGGWYGGCGARCVAPPLGKSAHPS